ncbi:deaminase reductase [Sphaerisporangium rufum]|uniref:Deaminase reductase n=1 Tax=Sphaerisporangium rufum TaxID=1381558 RepID=A0A919R6L4_9ACTN|nr:dihydrofolate reductase family protein [Sphaerisporangium rufum]GII80646.1 deaminase reductase [Sphaerisporangium rufum]
MGKVLIYATVSLDGFMAGPDVRPGVPMGDGGLRLHDWILRGAGSEVDAAVVRETSATTGAVVLGRRTFDVGLPVWEDTPYPVPCFVLTHRAHEPMVMKSGAFTFVTGGARDAVRQARAAAGDGNVVLMGATVSQECLAAGLVDGLRLQIAPVLLGAGLRLFGDRGPRGVELRRTEVRESAHVTHLWFDVLR